MDYLGWAATIVFVASYFCGQRALRRVQMTGAIMWVVYGSLLGAPPVIVANLLVFGAAAWTAWKGSEPFSTESALEGTEER